MLLIYQTGAFATLLPAGQQGSGLKADSFILDLKAEEHKEALPTLVTAA